MKAIGAGSPKGSINCPDILHEKWYRKVEKSGKIAPWQTHFNWKKKYWNGIVIDMTGVPNSK